MTCSVLSRLFARVFRHTTADAFSRGSRVSTVLARPLALSRLGSHRTHRPGAGPVSTCGLRSPHLSCSPAPARLSLSCKAFVYYGGPFIASPPLAPPAPRRGRGSGPLGMNSPASGLYAVPPGPGLSAASGRTLLGHRFAIAPHRAPCCCYGFIYRDRSSGSGAGRTGIEGSRCAREVWTHCVELER